LAKVILILQRIKKLENLAQNFNIVTWRWRHIWRHQKCRLHADRDGHLTKAFQKEKNMTLQVNC